MESGSGGQEDVEKIKLLAREGRMVNKQVERNEQKTSAEVYYKKEDGTRQRE